MSNALFPTLVGLTWNNTKTPMFNTLVQRSVNFRELRGSFTSAPVYSFLLSFDLLRDDSTFNELKQLQGFYLARQGWFDSWLYLDPDDSVALLQPFGTGGSSVDQFQLQRSIGAFSEPTKQVASGPLIYANGVLQTVGVDYIIDSNGLVSFTAPPSNGVALTWSGTYYHRCRFKENVTFREFMSQLWDAQQVEFLGALGTQLGVNGGGGGG